MSSKRAIRRRQCSGKHRYESRDSALGGMRALRKNKGVTDMLSAYHCTFCGGWHFGHPPRSIQRKFGR